MKAVWIGASEAETREQAEMAVSKLRGADFDTVFFSAADPLANYASEMMGWSGLVTEENDPLLFMAESCMRRNIALHARLCVGSLMQSEALRCWHPDWDLASISTFPEEIHWLNFAHPGVPGFLCSVMRELFVNYNLAGVHLDDMHYPLPPPVGPLDCTGLFKEMAVRDLMLELARCVAELGATSGSREFLLSASVMPDRAASESSLQNWHFWHSVDFLVPLGFFGSSGGRVLSECAAWWSSLPHRIVPGLRLCLDGVRISSGGLLEQIHTLAKYGLMEFGVMGSWLLETGHVSALASLNGQDPPELPLPDRLAVCLDRLTNAAVLVHDTEARLILAHRAATEARRILAAELESMRAIVSQAAEEEREAWLSGDWATRRIYRG